MKHLAYAFLALLSSLAAQEKYQTMHRLKWKGKDDQPLVKGEPQKDPTHSAVLGLMLQNTLKLLGVKCEVRHPLDGQPTTTMQEILLQHFKTERP